MKVYLTYWCNNGDYEDYHERVCGAYSTRKKAVATIEAAGFAKGVPEGFGWASKSKWHMPTMFDDEGTPWELHSMWVREMEVE